MKENTERTIVIKVTSRECPSVVKEYTLLVTLLDKQSLDSNPLLSGLSVQNHPELKFSKNVNNYSITLKKNETKVVVNAVPEMQTTTCTNDSVNRKFTNPGIITLNCVAQDGVSNETYRIAVKKQKSANVFLVILIVIIIVALLIYLVLRLLGYKIYFNFAMIGAFFRGIGESFRRMFDR